MFHRYPRRKFDRIVKDSKKNFSWFGAAAAITVVEKNGTTMIAGELRPSLQSSCW
jgi:hypothetical protein